jgi:transcriptional regulator with XRE-family HTH domain
MSIGARIRRRRKRLEEISNQKFPQAKLGQLIGYTEKTINDWETEKREVSLKAIPKLAVALQTTEEYLLHGDKSPKPEGPIEFEVGLKGRVTIDGVELTEEEKDKILQMARILRGK